MDENSGAEAMMGKDRSGNGTEPRCKETRTCGECEASRSHGEKTVYCRLYGIIISATHSGCRYGGKRWESITTGK